MELQHFQPAEDLVHKPLGKADQTNHLEALISLLFAPDWVTGNTSES